jgi:WD40 repeat protein
MRIIDVCDAPIRTVAVSPDGRYVAASANRTFAVLHWSTGEPVRRWVASTACSQIAFAPDGSWVAPGFPDQALELEMLDSEETIRLMTATRAAGGVAVAPDGKKLVATQFTGPNKARLAAWELPSLRPRPQSEFDGWPPFQRLAFSRNGEFVAGIWSGVEHEFRPVPAQFELRFARSGGRDYGYPPMRGPAYQAPGSVSFTHDSALCAFGWEDEFHVRDLSTGTSRELKYVKARFSDAAFTGSGRHFATVEDTGVLKFWDTQAWQVVHEYDWQCGPLTCLAFTADGSAGVCGTADGRLVQFDVDE